jgi:hypothetical protein
MSTTSRTTATAPRLGDPMPLSEFCAKADIPIMEAIWAHRLGLLELELRNGAWVISRAEIRRQQELTEARRRAREG